MIGWWESRRIPYNFIVGCAGIITIIAMFISATFGEIFLAQAIGLPDPPIIMILGILLYGIMANILYTGGWVIELVVRKLWPNEADSFATHSFALGVIFSVILTFVPGIITGGYCLVHIISSN